MPRRPLGRGRVLALVAAGLIIAACLLPWFTTGGGDGLPARELRAFDGSGILVFVGALLTAALVALPYAVGDRPVAIDNWVVYLGLFVLIVVGLVAWPIDLLSIYPQGLLPDRAPGYWLAVGGALVLARAVFEIHQAPPRR